MDTNSRSRGYAITIHNVFKNDEQFWAQLATKLNGVESVCSLEPYPGHPGYHFHIFIKFKNPQYKFALLNTIQMAQGDVHIDTLSDPSPGMKGRVHLEIMRGTMKQATAYLTQELTKKDKTCGLVMVQQFQVKCNTCDYRGQTRDWFQHTHQNGQTCHTCVFKAATRNLKDTQGEEFSDLFDTYKIWHKKYKNTVRHLAEN